MESTIAFILLGLVAGSLSGLIGIGGGVIIVPALVMIFGLSQLTAQGTTLALFALPVGLLAAWSYYRQGLVDIRVAALICIGFLIGGLIGSRFATHIPARTLSRIFGASLLFVAVKMLIAK